MTPVVLGIDGAPGGWVIAELRVARTGIASTCALRFTASIGAEVARLGNDLAVIAVDMPIGLSQDGHRPVDALARAHLGPRRATFFPTPVRAVLDQTTYDSANAISRSVSGKGLSKQAWNLVPKIRELDDAWRPDLAETLVEAHPESSFAEMAGTPVLSRKGTAVGRTERLDLLRDTLGIEAHVLESLPRRLHVDAIDALATAWTANRVVTHKAKMLGGELDRLGRPMQLMI